MRGGAEVDRLWPIVFAVSESVSTRAAAPSDTSEQSGALQGAGDKRILLAFGAAELVAKILAHLRIGIGDAVLVVLGRDQIASASDWSPYFWK